MAWVGNDTVVFTGHPVGTRTESWLYSWDLKTTPKALIKGASSFCVDGETISLSIRSQKEDVYIKISTTDYKVKAQKASRKIQGITYSSSYTCEAKLTPKKLIGHFWKELRDEQGFLDYGPLDGTTKNYAVTIANKEFTKLQDTGIRINLPTLLDASDWHPMPGLLIYNINLSTEERSHWQKTNRLTIWHLDANHRGHALVAPAGPWVNVNGGDIIFLKAKDGLVIISHGFESDGTAGGAGAYLVQPNGKFKKIETGYVGEPALSANGCLLAYSFENYSDLRSRPNEGDRILVATNLCN